MMQDGVKFHKYFCHFNDSEKLSLERSEKTCPIAWGV